MMSDWRCMIVEEDVAGDDEVEDSDEGSEYDLTIPEGIGLDDPVRMYLKEIGTGTSAHCRGRG
jgi:RNA polymerase primary sigma factor